MILKTGRRWQWHFLPLFLRLVMKGIGFYGILDFYPNKEKIKEDYEKLTLDEKILYKKEVYSICFEKEYVKDLIWEYLNGWEESQFNLGKEWRLKKTKMEQRMKYEDNNTDKIGQLERYYWEMSR